MRPLQIITSFDKHPAEAELKECFENHLKSLDLSVHPQGCYEFDKIDTNLIRKALVDGSDVAIVDYKIRLLKPKDHFSNLDCDIAILAKKNPKNHDDYFNKEFILFKNTPRTIQFVEGWKDAPLESLIKSRRLGMRILPISNLLVKEVEGECEHFFRWFLRLN